MRAAIFPCSEMSGSSSTPGPRTSGPPSEERGCLWPIILGALAGGMQIDETAREYGIEQEDVRAAIGYAARIVSQIAI